MSAVLIPALVTALVLAAIGLVALVQFVRDVDRRARRALARVYAIDHGVKPAATPDRAGAPLGRLVFDEAHQIDPERLDALVREAGIPPLDPWQRDVLLRSHPPIGATRARLGSAAALGVRGHRTDLPDFPAPSPRDAADRTFAELAARIERAEATLTAALNAANTHVFDLPGRAGEEDSSPAPTNPSVGGGVPPAPTPTEASTRVEDLTWPALLDLPVSATVAPLNYRSPLLPPPADPADPYGPPHASDSAPGLELLQGKVEGVAEVQDLHLQEPDRASGVTGVPLDGHGLEVARRRMHSSGPGQAQLRTGVVELRHETAPSVQTAPGATGPVDGAPSVGALAADALTVGAPTDTSASSPAPTSPVGGQVGDGVPPAPSPTAAEQTHPLSYAVTALLDAVGLQRTPHELLQVDLARGDGGDVELYAVFAGAPYVDATVRDLHWGQR